MTMTIQNKRRMIAAALCIALLLASCCASAHLAEHSCSFYDNCQLCQIFASAKLFSACVLVFFMSCALFSVCQRTARRSGLRSIFPATLVARFVQLND